MQTKVVSAKQIQARGLQLLLPQQPEAGAPKSQIRDFCKLVQSKQELVLDKVALCCLSGGWWYGFTGSAVRKAPGHTGLSRDPKQHALAGIQD